MNKLEAFKNLSSCGLPFRDLPSFFTKSLQVPLIFGLILDLFNSDSDSL